MATKVHMEALSPTMEEGQVVRWLKREGDPVAQGDILAEIETDKATMELVARGEGVLRRRLVAEGATAPVGDVIAIIAEESEDISSLEAAVPASDASEAGGPAPQMVDEGGSPEQPAAVDGTVSRPESPASGRVRASPVARRLALEAGVDLASLSGSGPAGRIVKRDVERAAQAGSAPQVAVEAPATEAGPEMVDVPLTQMRKTVARRLTESLGPVPHFFLTVEADMTRALEVRRSVNEVLALQGVKASINDLVIKATAAALIHHPECNAWWSGDVIRRFNRVHMAVAVAVPDGLITPVVRDAHAKGLAAISREVRELAARARDKRLQPHEYTGSTFSISNLGMFGIDAFTAVINPPEAGILAVGAVQERPVIRDGQLVARPCMTMTMSCDHRVIDGAQGARFLATLKSFLEEPAAILI